MAKWSKSSVLNAGTGGSFVAFPLLYKGAYGDSPTLLTLGGVLILLCMAAPFIARKI